MIRGEFILFFVFVCAAQKSEVLVNDINESPEDVIVKALLSTKMQLFKNLSTNGLRERAQDLVKLFSFLLPFQCSAPFEAIGDSCLFYNIHNLTWEEAERNCTTYGAHLSWIRTRTDFDVLQNFAKLKGHSGLLWIGLHKRGRNLTWSSGVESDYRGALFTNQDRPFFAIDFKDQQVDGKAADSRLKSICRSRSLNQNNSISDNLIALRTNAQTEIERTVRVVGVENNKVLLGILTSEQNRLFQCPPPWVRVKGMCLMYIFERRTRQVAADLCLSNGGTLVWFENEQEHDLIRNLGAWTPHSIIYNLFWIGLEKAAPNNKLIWSGYTNTDYYKGELSSGGNQKYMYFYATTSSKVIEGAPNNALKMSSICRRPLSRN